MTEASKPADGGESAHARREAHGWKALFFFRPVAQEALAHAFVDNHWTVMRECLCLVIALLYRVPARCPAV